MMRIVVCALALLMARSVAAQPAAGSVEVRGTVAAGQIYLDEGFPDHTEAGASARVFVSPRVAVQGEWLRFHSNVRGLPSEFRYTVNATALRLFGRLTRQVQPYLVGGVSVRSGGIGNTAIWPYGGAGLRVPLLARVSSDLEIGGPLLRIGASLGVRLR
jgi:hypothetical protein